MSNLENNLVVRKFEGRLRSGSRIIDYLQITLIESRYHDCLIQNEL